MPFNSKKYRRDFGFTNAEKLKKYFKAKDVIVVNWDRIELCNQRIKEIFMALNNVVHDSIKPDDITDIETTVDNAYQILKDNDIIPRLNNHGRALEDVYYNWMRGYAVCEYFSKALSLVFDIPKEQIRSVGQDQLADIETFSKSPTADLEITLEDKTVRLEIQSGFTGINDIKGHKVKEAKKMFNNEHIYTYVVHFDLFNGCAAIVDISNVDDNSIHWERRAQFEDQIVFSIPHDAFRWAITEEPTAYQNLLF